MHFTMRMRDVLDDFNSILFRKLSPSRYPLEKLSTHREFEREIILVSRLEPFIKMYLNRCYSRTQRKFVKHIRYSDGQAPLRLPSHPRQLPRDPSLSSSVSPSAQHSSYSSPSPLPNSQQDSHPPISPCSSL